MDSSDYPRTLSVIFPRFQLQAKSVEHKEDTHGERDFIYKFGQDRYTEEVTCPFTCSCEISQGCDFICRCGAQEAYAKTFVELPTKDQYYTVVVLRPNDTTRVLPFGWPNCFLDFPPTLSQLALLPLCGTACLACREAII